MDILVTVVATILLLVALAGLIIPVLPGSPVAVISLIGWAWILGSTTSWVTGAIAALICAIGWSASLILTGRTMARQKIPAGPVWVAVLAGIVGFFLIPILGLFIGFAVGLFGAEYYRRKDAAQALQSSVQALKAMGIGMLIEIGCLMVGIAVFGVGVLVHFLA